MRRRYLLILAAFWFAGAYAQQLKFDPAIPPVEAADMQAVIERDAAEAVKSGFLVPRNSVGVTIGVVRKGVRRVFSLGTAEPDSIFEIGSITKTFTGLVLAQMLEQGTVQRNEPVRALLPKGVVEQPAGAEITLLDLITQHSGLPRMPDNFHPSDPHNPFVDYSAQNLYEFLGKHGVAKPAAGAYLYSNVGIGLLGQALANRAGVDYATLVRDAVTRPLGLRDTVVTLSRQQQARFIEGHSADHQPTHSWELDALAGAGALRSTADDMLTYLQAQLHPDQLSAKVTQSKYGRTLRAALQDSHELLADADPATHIAFAWMFVDSTGNFWHDGGTGGYTSFAFFNPKEDYAAIVLVNTGVDGPRGNFADVLGQHIGRRFAGAPAISLMVVK